ncbi:MAG: PD-(D/E)XK nuclease domain-containing protein, partial [Acidiferrobacterales bacterium]|nr:PD-(D/E)XK nuclease domain-containing protein [Acidiferrobacterales bacterium]
TGRAFLVFDLSKEISGLQAYLSGIPHQWYDVSEIDRFEAHYAGMLYLALRSVEVDLRVDDVSSHGRSDMTVLHAGQVFVLEFKMAGDGGDSEGIMAEAMDQLRGRGYADKYRDRDEPIHLVGLVFGRLERTLLGIRAERA